MNTSRSGQSSLGPSVPLAVASVFVAVVPGSAPGATPPSVAIGRPSPAAVGPTAPRASRVPADPGASKASPVATGSLAGIPTRDVTPVAVIQTGLVRRTGDQSALCGALAVAG